MKAMKKTILLFLCCALVFGAMPFTSVIAIDDCGAYISGNELSNRYTYYWADPMYSYLFSIAGGYMRFQADIIRYSNLEHSEPLTDSYLIEYYDAEYNLLNNKLISKELPLFGGLYFNGTNFYLLSGQLNKEESADVECYRITKYDLEWNRLSSCGLYDCNTSYPFRAGCPRFVEDENLLVIHTSHEMYASNDGNNHQSNYTLFVDIENMTMTGTNMVYTSHSMNQFIKVDGNKYITVDHGDAYPRSIVLRVTERQDNTLYKLNTATLFEFIGEIGENYTGAVVGGLEISESSYLTAFCSVEQNENYKSNRTENVFLAVTDKTSCTTTLKQITAIQEGETGAETPQLVKIDENKFLLIWQIGNVLYYCYFDGNGNRVGEVKTFEGAILSDCQPIVVNGKAVWYSYNENEVAFYEISDNECNAKTVDTYHKFQVIFHDEADPGRCVWQCEICGRINDITTGTNILVYFGEDGYTYYRKGKNFKFEPGADVPLYWTNYYGDHNKENKLVLKIIYENEVIQELSDNFEITFPQNGYYKLVFSLKYNPYISVTYRVKVGECVEPGDVNADGTVDNLDAVEVLKYDCGLLEEISYADVNYDGEVNNLDAVFILRYAAGFIEAF